MRVGYKAAKNRGYQTALINFRRALSNRPNDSYARNAIRDVEASIARRRMNYELQASRRSITHS